MEEHDLPGPSDLTHLRGDELEAPGISLGSGLPDLPGPPAVQADEIRHQLTPLGVVQATVKLLEDGVYPSQEVVLGQRVPLPDGFPGLGQEALSSLQQQHHHMLRNLPGLDQTFGALGHRRR